MKIALAVFGALILAQLIKGIVHAARHRFDPLAFFKDGGFPSGHSAFVTSLALSVYIEEGWSTLFVAVLVFSLIVLNDSFRVRRETGDEAKAINQIIKHQKMKFRHLTESEGHTFGQVVAGVMLGTLVSSVVYLIL